MSVYETMTAEVVALAHLRLTAEVDNLNECLSEMTTKAWGESHRADAAEAEVDRLRAAQVPDGHVRIDGKLYEVVDERRPWCMNSEVHYSLVPVEDTDD